MPKKAIFVVYSYVYFLMKFFYLNCFCRSLRFEDCMWYCYKYFIFESCNVIMLIISIIVLKFINKWVGLNHLASYFFLNCALRGLLNLYCLCFSVQKKSINIYSNLFSKSCNIAETYYWQKITYKNMYRTF